uniref:Nab2 type CCCH zinc finger 4 domain-containing protein n=1 Tax=Chromera velia CCMP2878 TaxID=1169474 RepID=A0A0G4I574_9ALVE|eukprot:Cvel_11112.t1-p1 / transcript=Cvel_11112.t1 / gene=Cvel_11112 / organism=Chromera_velia_CCMP2878 / gene_product=hypothetical protein / transcript_product=hypothetical protein / location=Cvel_scaffold688:8500-11900(-) / protein_length=922 / sequence_SO=supercontig / SO=protein_coding / is_pseudo=false
MTGERREVRQYLKDTERILLDNGGQVRLSIIGTNLGKPPVAGMRHTEFFEQYGEYFHMEGTGGLKTIFLDAPVPISISGTNREVKGDFADTNGNWKRSEGKGAEDGEKSARASKSEESRLRALVEDEEKASSWEVLRRLLPQWKERGRLPASKDALWADITEKRDGLTRSNPYVVFRDWQFGGLAQIDLASKKVSWNLPLMRTCPDLLMGSSPTGPASRAASAARQRAHERDSQWDLREGGGGICAFKKHCRDYACVKSHPLGRPTPCDHLVECCDPLCKYLHAIIDLADGGTVVSNKLRKTVGKMSALKAKMRGVVTESDVPVMCPKGADCVFNEKCRNLHFAKKSDGGVGDGGNWGPADGGEWAQQPWCPFGKGCRDFFCNRAHPEQRRSPCSNVTECCDPKCRSLHVVFSLPSGDTVASNKLSRTIGKVAAIGEKLEGRRAERVIALCPEGSACSLKDQCGLLHEACQTEGEPRGLPSRVEEKEKEAAHLNSPSATAAALAGVVLLDEEDAVPDGGSLHGGMGMEMVWQSRTPEKETSVWSGGEGKNRGNVTQQQAERESPQRDSRVRDDPSDSLSARLSAAWGPNPDPSTAATRPSSPLRASAPVFVSKKGGMDLSSGWGDLVSVGGEHQAWGVGEMMKTELENGQEGGVGGEQERTAILPEKQGEERPRPQWRRQAQRRVGRGSDLSVSRSALRVTPLVVDGHAWGLLTGRDPSALDDLEAFLREEISGGAGDGRELIIPRDGRFFLHPDPAEGRRLHVEGFDSAEELESGVMYLHEVKRRGWAWVETDFLHPPPGSGAKSEGGKIGLKKVSGGALGEAAARACEECEYEPVGAAVQGGMEVDDIVFVVADPGGAVGGGEGSGVGNDLLESAAWRRWPSFQAGGRGNALRWVVFAGDGRPGDALEEWGRHTRRLLRF